MKLEQTSEHIQVTFTFEEWEAVQRVVEALPRSIPPTDLTDWLVDAVREINPGLADPRENQPTPPSA